MIDSSFFILLINVEIVAVRKGSVNENMVINSYFDIPIAYLINI